MWWCGKHGGFMCGEFITEYAVKARKHHWCTACNVPIPPGFLYIRTFEKDNRDLMVGKWHIECRETFNGYLNEYGDDCMDPWLTWENGMPGEIKQKYLPGPIEP